VVTKLEYDKVVDCEVCGNVSDLVVTLDDDGTYNINVTVKCDRCVDIAEHYIVAALTFLGRPLQEDIDD
jgi:hypothetical protein